MARLGWPASCAPRWGSGAFPGPPLVLMVERCDVRAQVYPKFFLSGGACSPSAGVDDEDLQNMMLVHVRESHISRIAQGLVAVILNSA